MRRLIVATLTAALVVIGLSAVLLGTASASTPAPAKAGDSCILTPAAGDVPAVPGHKTWQGVCVALTVDVHVGGNGNGADCPGDRYPNLNGCQHTGGGVGLPGRGLPQYRDCNDYRSHGIRDIRRGDSRYVDSWDRNRDGIACDDGDVVVSSDGQCVTFLNDNRNYGNQYNSAYNVRLDRARSINSDGGRAITARERRDIEDAADLRDFRNRWTSSRDSLRTICNDPTPPVTIINEAPAAAPVTVTAAPPPPPAPVTSSGGGSLPAGHYNGGGWSTAFTLAHARVQ